MKGRWILVICMCIFLLSACKQEEPQAPVNAVQENVEDEITGTIFAHTQTGDLYYSVADGKTTVIKKTESMETELAVLEGVWRFSAIEETQQQPYMLFDGYMEAANGYRGGLYAYTEQTGHFAPVFDESTSNAAILPTADENYADLAWVLVQYENDVLLCPFNMRDGSTETGQIVSLAETEYAIEGEPVLVSLKTDAAYPLQIRIENKTYEGTSVLSTTAYIYDFETETLTKVEEE